MELKLNRSTVPFSLEHTLDCGQLFRWEKLGDWWYGVVADRVVKIKQDNEEADFSGFSRNRKSRLYRKLPTIR